MAGSSNMSDINFHKKLEIGEKGECFILGYLYSKSLKDTIYRVAQYSKKFKETFPETFKSYGNSPYRWNNRELPDFYVISPNKQKKFVEAKCKQGFKGDVCLSTKHVKGYIDLYETTGIDIELYMILKNDRKMYKMTIHDLLAHGRERSNSNNPKDPYYAWSVENLEAVMENLPVEIFETSYR